MSKTLDEPIASPMAPILSAGLKLFDGEPAATSVRQQMLTNCPLPALLAAMANGNKSGLKKMVQERNAPAQSWFYGRPVTSAGKFQVSRIITVHFQHASVEVSPLLYVNNLMKPRFTFSETATTAGWASYIEKAYVNYRAAHTYENLNLLSTRNPLSVERIMEDLVHDFSKLEIGVNGGTLLRDLEEGGEGGFGTSDFADYGKDGLKKKLIDMFKLAKERPTIATTPSSASNHGALNLVGSHTYAVLRYADGRVTVYDAMRVREHKLKTSDFIKAFDALFQARPKN